MNTEQVSSTALGSEQGHLKTLMRSKRVKIYTGVILIISLIVVSLKTLFPPVSVSTHETAMTPLFKEETVAVSTGEVSEETVDTPVLKNSEKQIRDTVLPLSAQSEENKDQGQLDTVSTLPSKAEMPAQQVSPAERKIPTIQPMDNQGTRNAKKGKRSQELLESTVYNLGVTYLENNEPIRAVLEFNKVLTINPMNIQAYNNLGLALLESEDENGAKSAFEKALAIQADCKKCMNNLALLYLKQGDLENTAVLLNRLVANNPENIEAWTNLGVTYRKQGRFPDAEKAYSKALELSPSDYRIHFNLARTLEREDKITAAIYHYESFLRLLPPYEGSRAEQTMNHIDQLKRSIKNN